MFVVSHAFQLSMIPGLFAFWWGAGAILGGFDSDADVAVEAVEGSETGEENHKVGCMNCVILTKKNARRLIDWAR